MKHITFFTLLLVTMFACKTDEEVGCTNSDSFDRGALLTNWADNIIIPSYTAYVADISELNRTANLFIASPNQSTLDAVRGSWLEAYTTWQNVSIYEIGQAEIINLRSYTNSYPLDVSLVESNINSGVYDLKISTNVVAQGFPAVDFLLNGIADSEAEIIEEYTIADNATKNAQYLLDVIARLSSMGNEVLADWNGSYRGSFIADDCSSSTASLDKLTNDLIFNLEKETRTGKIGIPIDFFGTPPVIAPEKVEALYKQDVSKELFLASLEASQNLFNGKHLTSDTEGESLKSYLNEIHAEAGGRSLSVVINEYYDTAILQAQLLDNDFYTGIQNDRDKYETTRDNLHNVIQVLKTNMLSELGIKSDFNDSDGD